MSDLERGFLPDDYHDRGFVRELFDELTDKEQDLPMRILGWQTVILGAALAVLCVVVLGLLVAEIVT